MTYQSLNAGDAGDAGDAEVYFNERFALAITFFR